MSSTMKDEDMTSDFMDENFDTKSEDESELPVVTEKFFIQQLINLYRDNRILWDPKHPDYCKKDLRHRTLQGITKVLRQYDPDYTISQFKRKINIIRTNYNKERRRVATARSNGDYDRQPGLWYFHELEFLSPAADARANKYGEDDGSHDADHATPAEPAEDDAPEPAKATLKPVRSCLVMPSRKRYPRTPPRSRERVRARSPPGPRLRGDASSEAEVIGRYWAVKLCRLDPTQRQFAEKIINDIFFEGEMGNLTRSGVCIIKSPSDDEQ